MLINKLLFALTVENNREIIEACHYSSELEAVYKEHCEGNPVFSCLIEKNILQVDVLPHILTSFQSLPAGDKNSLWFFTHF